MTDILNAEEISRGLTTAWLGKRVEVVEATASTMDDCAALARAGAPAGTIVAAGWQSAGRGRRGRRWTAPPGAALLVSILLRPSLPASAVGRIGMAGALAVVDSVWAMTGLSASAKYPNDVLIRERKVAGILPEAHLSAGAVEWAVLGIGLNVRRTAVPPDLLDRATSLEEHTAPPGRAALLRDLLARLEMRLDQAENDAEALAVDWNACDAVLGRDVTVALGRMRLRGFAASVDADGFLLLRLVDGSLRRLSPAEVSLRV